MVLASIGTEIFSNSVFNQLNGIYGQIGKMQEYLQEKFPSDSYFCPISVNDKLDLVLLVQTKMVVAQLVAAMEKLVGLVFEDET